MGVDFGKPHRRYNPLLDEWVLVSPHRTQRPWQGQVETSSSDTRPSYDPACYLCPGNARASGDINPRYTSTFEFPNDFPALIDTAAEAQGDLFRSMSAAGECRVLCFSPRHDLTMADLSIAEIEAVVDLWSSVSAELLTRWDSVVIFENKGAAMGCSNPHPHGQVWATREIPSLISKEAATQEAYFARKQAPLLLDVAEAEVSLEKRVVSLNDDWLVVVPFWATWPFETLLLPRFPVQRLPELAPPQRRSLADILSQLTKGYDRLFSTSFPYSMGWHQAPANLRGSAWQLHAHFFPPLLRSAQVRKFMVGFEMLGEAQRDLTPEQAAELLSSAIRFTRP